MITAYKAIYKLFCSGVYHKTHSIFRSGSYTFRNKNIVLFSGNDTSMDGYSIRIHRNFRMKKALIATVSSAEFNTMSLNSELSKVVSYIQDNKYWSRIYVLLKLISPYIQVICLADSNKSGMDKVFYYSIITKISIIKS